MEIIQYVRDVNGDPDAVLVARKNDKEVIQISWSAVRPPDRFSKHLALHIARNRFESGTSAKIPMRIRPLIPDFRNRCRKYFRTFDVSIIGSMDLPEHVKRTGKDYWDTEFNSFYNA